MKNFSEHHQIKCHILKNFIIHYAPILVFLFICILGYIYLQFDFSYALNQEFKNDEFSERPTIFNFFKTQKVQRVKKVFQFVEIDEIFGSKYIEKLKKKNKKTKEEEKKQKKQTNLVIKQVDDISQFDNNVDDSKYVNREDYDSTAEEFNKAIHGSQKIIKGLFIPGLPLRIPPVDRTANIQPQYTHEAKRAGIEGFVRLQLIINKEGRVESLRVVSSKNRKTGKSPLGYGLEKSAMKAYKKKIFTPAMEYPPGTNPKKFKKKEGKPFKVNIIEDVRFVLI